MGDGAHTLLEQWSGFIGGALKEHFQIREGSNGDNSIRIAARDGAHQLRVQAREKFDDAWTPSLLSGPERV